MRAHNELALAISKVYFSGQKKENVDLVVESLISTEYNKASHLSATKRKEREREREREMEEPLRMGAKQKKLLKSSLRSVIFFSCRGLFLFVLLSSSF